MGQKQLSGPTYFRPIKEPRKETTLTKWFGSASYGTQTLCRFLRAMDEGESMQSQPAAEVAQDVKIPSENNANPTRRFDPSRMIGIIRRKALIKKLAAAYHAECLARCQELLELQKNMEEPIFDFGTPEVDMRKRRSKPPKRSKKTR